MMRRALWGCLIVVLLVLLLILVYGVGIQQRWWDWRLRIAAPVAAPGPGATATPEPTDTPTPEPTITPTATPDQRVACAILAHSDGVVVYQAEDPKGDLDVYAWQYSQVGAEPFRLSRAPGPGTIVAAVVPGQLQVAVARYRTGGGAHVSLHNLLSRNELGAGEFDANVIGQATNTNGLGMWVDDAAGYWCLATPENLEKAAELGLQEFRMSPFNGQVSQDIKNLLSEKIPMCNWPPSG